MRDDRSDALREAMAAAIASKEYTLRWEDIAIRAGVKRATAFRRKELQDEWREACRSHRVVSEQEIRDARKTVTSAETKKELHRKVATMATHLEALVSLIAARDVQIGMLERQLQGAAKIVRLTP